MEFLKLLDGGGRFYIKKCTLRQILYAKKNTLTVTFLHTKSQTLLDQCSCELTNISLLIEYIVPLSREISLVFVPHIETVLEIMKLVRTKDISGH